jgi:hypothetical protein
LSLDQIHSISEIKVSLAQHNGTKQTAMSIAAANGPQVRHFAVMVEEEKRYFVNIFNLRGN